MRRTRTYKAAAGALALAFLLAACGGNGEESAPQGTVDPPAPAEPEAEPEVDEVAEFYAANTVTFIVPFSPGGGYDSDARAIAQFLAEELGTNVVIDNQPGAGGLLAVSSMAQTAHDGLTISMLNGVGTVSAALRNDVAVQFDVEELGYIGRVGWSARLVATTATSPFTSIDAMRGATGFTWGATGAGSPSYIEPVILNELLGIDAPIGTAFAGATEVRLSVTRGEVFGMTGVIDAQLPDVESGDHAPVLLIGTQRDPRLPDTPTILELPEYAANAELIDAYVAMLGLGRMVVTSPEVPAERLAFLRAAFDRAMARQDTLDALINAGREPAAATGEESLQLIRTALGSPPALVDLLGD